MSRLFLVYGGGLQCVYKFGIMGKISGGSSKPGLIDNNERKTEWCATFGLLLICVALVVPFFSPGDLNVAHVMKWIYAGGALIYTVARVVGARGKGSLRLRRLRRMEFWAGIAFIVAAAFWFYTEQHLGPYAGMLALLRQTILFTLVGAVIQVIASWLIVSRQRKEAVGEGDGKGDSR